MLTMQYRDTKIAYYCVPKCGKTTVKSIFKTLKQEGGDYHNYGYSKISPLSRRRGKDAHRFTVIRDPIARLVSAYNDRVGDRDDIARSSISVSLCHIMGLNPSPCLEEFSLNLRKYAAINDRIFRHVVPQTWYTGKDLSFFHQIYNIQDMDQVFADVSQLTEVTILPKVRNASRSNAKSNDLSNEALNYLQHFYRNDYHTFEEYL